MKRTKFPTIQISARVIHLGRQEGIVWEIIGKGPNRLIYVKFNAYEASAVQESDLELC